MTKSNVHSSVKFLRSHPQSAHPIREYGSPDARWVMQGNGVFRLKEQPKTEEEE